MPTIITRLVQGPPGQTGPVGPTGPIAPPVGWGLPITSAGVAASTKELIDTSGGSFARTFPATPVAGQKQSFHDFTGTWSTSGKKFTVTGSTGQRVQDPANPTSVSAPAGSVDLLVAGATPEWEWVPDPSPATTGEWIVV
jgi:hypothetical protein